jgi:hypothetical protein
VAIQSEGRNRVRNRSREKADGSGVESPARERFVHQIERQRRDQHAGAERHDPCDEPFRKPTRVTDDCPISSADPATPPHIPARGHTGIHPPITLAGAPRKNEGRRSSNRRPSLSAP